jgi:hypothetical protein
MITPAGMVKTIAGNPDPAVVDTNDGTGMAGHFGAPSMLANDGKYLYVADVTFAGQGTPPPNVIRRVEIATGKVETIAGAFGSAGHVDDVGTAARFSGIVSLACDGTSLFIGDAEAFGDRPRHIGPTVRQMVLATGSVTTMLGAVGQQTLKPGVGTAARVHWPSNLVFDAATHTMFFYDFYEYTFGRIK